MIRYALILLCSVLPSLAQPVMDMLFAPTPSGLIQLQTNAWFAADNYATNAGIATWTDGSGSGNNFTVGNSDYFPAREANALNGRPALKFTGDDYMTNYTYSYAADREYWLVYEEQSVTLRNFFDNPTLPYLLTSPTNNNVILWIDYDLDFVMNGDVGPFIYTNVPVILTFSLCETNIAIYTNNVFVRNQAYTNAAQKGMELNWSYGTLGNDPAASCRYYELLALNRPTTGTERTNIYNDLHAKYFRTLTNLLVAHWTLDETSGTRYDSIGTNHFTPNGSSLPGYGAGVVSKATTFTSNQLQYLSAVDSPELSTESTSWTFCGWFNAGSSNSVNNLAAKFNVAGSREWFLQKTITNNLAAGYSPDRSASTVVYSNSKLYTNSWHLACAMVDKDSKKLILSVDAGDWVTNSLSAINTVGTSATFTLGRAQGVTTSLFDGAADDCALWKRVLYTDEITQIYTNGLSGIGILSIP